MKTSKVKVLLNHFGLNTTFVVGNWCMNGCTVFHKDDADHIFELHGVPNYYSDDVMNLFSDDPIDFKYFINSICDFDKLAGIYDITELFATCCDNEHYLNLLLNLKSIQPTGDTKCIIINKNVDILNKILMKDWNWVTRLRVVNATKNIDILTHLSNDEDCDVKRNAIQKLGELK